MINNPNNIIPIIFDTQNDNLYKLSAAMKFEFIVYVRQKITDIIHKMYPDFQVEYDNELSSYVDRTVILDSHDNEDYACKFYPFDEITYTTRFTNDINDQNFGYTGFKEYNKIYYKTIDGIQSMDLHFFIYQESSSQNLFLNVFVDRRDVDKINNIKMACDQYEKQQFVLSISDDTFPDEANKTASNLQKFFSVSNVKKLKEYHYPVQYGLIIIGDPGLGKSMFVKSLQYKLDGMYFHYKRCPDIRYYTPSDILNKAKNGDDLGSSGIIVLDDVDNMFKAKDIDGYPNVALSWLLTQMDVTNECCRLVIMIANKLDYVEPALIRPGRFDSIIKFETPTDSKIENMLRFVTKYDTTITEPNIKRYVDIIKSCDKISLASISLAGRFFYSGIADNWEEAILMAFRDKNENNILNLGKAKKVGF